MTFDYRHFNINQCHLFGNLMFAVKKRRLRFFVTVAPTTNGFLYDAEIYIILQLIITTRNMDSALSWMTTHLFYARNNILLSSIYPLNILAITCDDHIYQV